VAKVIAIVGGAWYLRDQNLEALMGVETIGCNRGLRFPTFTPSHLMISDRRHYLSEIGSGLLHRRQHKTNIMLPTLLFNVHRRCHGVPAFDIPSDLEFMPWLCGTSRTPMNWTSFEKPLCSFCDVGGQMLQAAVIMGATVIGMTGVGLMEPTGHKHWYDESIDDWPADSGAWRPKTVACYKRAKMELDGMGIEVLNLSPERLEFDSIWGNYGFDRFVKEYCQ